MKKALKAAVVLLVIVLMVFVYVWIQGQPKEALKYTQEYIPGTGNIVGDVDTTVWAARGEAFEIGANDDGVAVFKNPRKAMNAICEGYTEGIKAMRKQGAPAFFRLNYEAYMGYAESVPQNTKAAKQASVVAGFVDIYENSFTE